MRRGGCAHQFSDSGSATTSAINSVYAVSVTKQLQPPAHTNHSIHQFRDSGSATTSSTISSVYALSATPLAMAARRSLTALEQQGRQAPAIQKKGKRKPRPKRILGAVVRSVASVWGLNRRSTAGASGGAAGAA